MEERPAETNSHVDRSAPPSVAQLAGRFREQAAAAKETPSSKPTRRKPPCSLPLFPPKVELGQNGEEKSPSNASQLPKIKVKSSPLIEKLQASLTFDPAALLPGASPKSPGLKAMVSPFHSPPSTPSSPGVRSQPSEAEEVPVSFDQPPEGTHLPCYNKVRTRGSIKRRPPSRRFRRSQSDCGELGDFRAVEPAQENGAREEDGDDVFPTKSQAPGSPSPREGTLGEGVGAKLESAENPPGRRTSSSAGEPEQEQQQQQQQQQAAGITAEGTPCKKAEEADQPAAREADPEPPRTASPGAQNGCASPAAEETDPGKEGSAAHEENRPAQKSGDPKTPEEGALGEKTPPHAGGGAEGSSIPEKGPEEQEEGRTVDPGCSQASLETSKEIQTGPNVLMDGTQDEETRM